MVRAYFDSSRIRGDPSLRIREPIEPRPEDSEKSTIGLRWRRAHIFGIMVNLCSGLQLVLTNGQKSSAERIAPEDMEKLFRGVEGQYLVSARIVEATKTCSWNLISVDV